MRIAAPYDIHGNLPALEAVLEEVEAAGPEPIVVGGDLVPGPMPSEVMDRLDGVETPVVYIRGNGEQDVLSHLRGSALEHLPEEVRPLVRWRAGQLPEARAHQMAQWPETIMVERGRPGGVLFCHGTPRSATEIVTRYDLAEAADRVRATAYPQAESFASGNILEPPAASGMLELLEGAARKTSPVSPPR